MQNIFTDKAPAAIGPYSQGKLVNGLAFFSGSISLDPVSGAVVGDDITTQSQQVMKNIAALLEAAGCGFEDVVKTTCFLADMADFAAFNQVYAESFISKPARSCVAVRTLPKNVLVEVEVIAQIK